LALPGCERSKSIRQPPATDTHDGGAAARSCAVDLERWLDEVRSDGLPDLSDRVVGIEPATAPASATVERVALPANGRAAVEVTRDSITCHNELFGSADPTGTIVIQDVPGMKACLQEEARAHGHALSVSLDKSTRWALLVQLSSMSAASFDRIAFVLEKDWRATPPHPWPPRLAEQADMVGRARRGSARIKDALATRWHESIYTRCADARRLFDGLSIDEENPTSYADAVAAKLEELPRAFARCSCAADLLEVKFHAWALAGRHEVPKALVAMTVPLGHGPSDARIGAPAGSSWGSAVTRISEALQRKPGQPVILKVDDP
jgi:hypothetical protein